MADRKTPNRQLPLPDPKHSAVTDASRIAEAFSLIDNDLAVLLKKATYEALGRVVIGSAANIAAGDTETVPTALAVQQHVAAAIADLVGSAPGVLDTLAELATALGNDPNFATTIIEMVATKADKEATAIALNAKADQAAMQEALNNRYTKDQADTAFIKTGYGIHRNPMVAAENFDLMNHDSKGDFWRLCFWAGRFRIRDSANKDLITFGADGGIFSPIWEGGDLKHHIEQRCRAFQNDTNNYLNAHIENRCGAFRDDTHNWVRGNFVQDMRLNGWWETTLALQGWTHCPNGGVPTALHKGGSWITHFGGRYQQFMRNGQWITEGVW